MRVSRDQFKFLRGVLLLHFELANGERHRRGQLFLNHGMSYDEVELSITPYLPNRFWGLIHIDSKRHEQTRQRDVRESISVFFHTMVSMGTQY